MPRRPPTPCAATPLCPHDTPCPDHPREQRPTTAARGYGSRHQAIARELKRRHPRGPCARCGRAGDWNDRHDPLTAGHKVHAVDGGATTIENYQPEHASCGTRESVTRRVARRGR